MQPDEVKRTIEAFIQGARRPALLEPGEEVLALAAGNFELELRGARLTLQAWDDRRNLVRRVMDIEERSSGRIGLAVERFARRAGRLYLLDLDRPAGAELGRRSGRLVFRERFRLLLRRQFPQWSIEELSADPDLEHSLSPAYPRAFLKHGQSAWAAIAAPEESDAAGLLTFGLIWLAHLRRRETRVAVEGLALYLPAGAEGAAALRALCLDPAAARFELFVYAPDDAVTRVDPRDWGNLDTRLDVCRARPLPPAEWRSVADLPGVECVPLLDGRTSLRVHGLEFAESAGELLRYGLGECRTAAPGRLGEAEALARELVRARSADAPDREHPLFRQSPEAWLESSVRADLETIDASLLPTPVYGQAPSFAGGDRGVIDLLAAGRDGRLAVLELKASADIHLPLQALDYWLRVKWHLDRGEFGSKAYFPGLALSRTAPRLLLISPSLEFHSTTETILEFFAPAIEVLRIGLAIEWRKGVRVMFRLPGAQRP